MKIYLMHQAERYRLYFVLSLMLKPEGNYTPV
jgi:hypothetical protein